MMNHCFNAYAFVAFVFVGLFCSCSGGKDIIVQDADSETICEIMTVYEDEEIGRLNSIAAVDSSHFVLSTDSKVYLYDMSGHCISKIGRSGNAGYEYNMPLYVRSDGELIYVWSAMTMKFVSYTIDGVPVGEYGYDSALRDFCPSGDCIVIYPAAREYINANPSMMLVIDYGGALYVMTSEGRYKDSPGGIRNDEDRYCSLYRAEDRGGRKVSCFTMSSFGYGNLLSVYEGKSILSGTQ